jgi:ketosteroid isomerase-like protein
MAMPNPVQDFLARLAAGDLPAALDLVAPDAVFAPEGPADLPIYGHFAGREGAARLFRTLGDLFDTESFEIFTWAETGDTVFAHGAMRHRVRQSGATVESGFALVVTLAAGKIAHWRIFENTAAFQAALG